MPAPYVQAVIHPLGQLRQGFSYFPRGVAWLRQHPRYLMALLLPVLAGVVSLVLVGSLLWDQRQALLARLVFTRPDAGLMLVLYYAVVALVYAAMAVVTTVSALIVACVIGAPVNDYVSLAVERSLIGEEARDLSFRQSLRLIPEEIKKAFVILGISILMLCIPGINVITIIITAFLIGWEFCDYPLVRRGWTLQERWRFVYQEKWAVMAFGLWLTIPIIQIFLMPLAVVGGTMLSIDRLSTQRSSP